MHLSTRVSRPVGALAIGLALVGIGVAVPAAAEAPTNPSDVLDAAPRGELVGEPTLLLIESRHATGRVLEIGNPGAEPTAPDGETPAAAASFARATDPAAALAQAVLAYPIDGDAAAFVLVSQDGAVLARRHNDDASYRYLELLDVTVDEAAADPYAVWRSVDAGGGWTAIQNAQVDGSGATAALDMYNWRDADAAEIQTYTAGSAAVQQWALHGLGATVGGIDGLVLDGRAPTLPTDVAATYEFGVTVPLAEVTWDAPPASAWEEDGVVEVAGSGTGWFGETVPVRARYIVGTLGNAVDSEIASFAGVTLAQLRMAAPRTVERVISGTPTTVTAPVTWDWAAVSAEDLAAAGELRVPATAATGFEAVLIVSLAEAAPVNLLRSGASFHPTAAVGTGLAPLTDGNRTAPAFSDWRSGGAGNRANPNLVSLYLDEPQLVTGAGVYALAGDAQNNNIGRVTVQYRDLRGGWYDLPLAEGTWPLENTSTGLSLEVEAAEPVVATAMRVRIWNKSNDTWMGLSEIEILGPRPVPAP